MRLFTSLVIEVGRDFIPGDIAVMHKKGLCFGQIETESTKEHTQCLGYLVVITERPLFFFLSIYYIPGIILFFLYELIHLLFTTF